MHYDGNGWAKDPAPQATAATLYAVAALGSGHGFVAVGDKGTVLLEKECRPVERGMVGVVAQDYPLFEHRTVRGNMPLKASLLWKDSSRSVNSGSAAERMWLPSWAAP